MSTASSAPTASLPPAMRPATTTSPSSLLLLSLILALAAGLRIYNLSALGYWTDEFVTLMNANGWGIEINRLPLDQVVPPRPTPTRLAQARPWSQIAAGMIRDDSHPPLYPLLVRGWETLFGDGEPAVRSLNVILSVSANAVLFFVAVESVGTSAALWACLLMAVAGPQIELAQDAYKFPLLMWLALVAALSLVRLRQGGAPRGWAVVLGASALAMMLTHYFAAGSAIGLGLYALLDLRGRARRNAVIALGCAAVAFVAAWGPHLLKQRPNFTSNYNWVADSEPAGHAARVLFDLARLPARHVAELPSDGWSALVGAALLLLVVVGAVRRPQLRLFVLWFCCTVALVACMDLARNTLQLRVVRYTLAATPALYVIITAAGPAGRLKFVVPALFVALAIVRLPAAYLPPWKTDFRTPVEIVEGKLRSGDGLVLASNDPVMVRVTYTAFQHYAGAGRMPKIVAALTRPVDKATLDALRTCRRLWVVWMNADDRVAEWLPGLRVEQAGRLSSREQIIEGTLSPPPAGG